MPCCCATSAAQAVGAGRDAAEAGAPCARVQHGADSQPSTPAAAPPGAAILPYQKKQACCSASLALRAPDCRKRVMLRPGLVRSHCDGGQRGSELREHGARGARSLLPCSCRAMQCSQPAELRSSAAQRTSCSFGNPAARSPLQPHPGQAQGGANDGQRGRAGNCFSHRAEALLLLLLLLLARPKRQAGNGAGGGCPRAAAARAGRGGAGVGAAAAAACAACQPADGLVVRQHLLQAARWQQHSVDDMRNCSKKREQAVGCPGSPAGASWVREQWGRCTGTPLAGLDKQSRRRMASAPAAAAAPSLVWQTSRLERSREAWL